MIRNIIRYVVLTIIVIGIVALLGSLVNKDSVKFNSDNKLKETSTNYYTASIKVIDKDTNNFIKGGTFVLKNNKNEVISEWTANENIKRINKLKNGTYTLEQKSATEGYEKSDKITFKIYNSSKDVVVYNQKEETKNVVSSNEVSVDNTLSTKSIFVYIISIIITCYGVVLVNKKAKA